MAGYDLEIDSPRYVPLDIALTICVMPHTSRAVVRQALLDAFSNRDLPDGSRGFFHPDNFTFGQPVYLSQVIARAMDVPGVRSVMSVDRFQRYGEDPHGEIDAGFIPHVSARDRAAGQRSQRAGARSPRVRARRRIVAGDGHGQLRVL